MNKTKQLKLSEEQLLAIGFVKREVPEVAPSEEGDFGSASKTLWEIPTINGCFYCNNAEDIYVWYHKTLISNSANFVNLDITHKASLFTVLSAFNVKFNLVIKG